MGTVGLYFVVILYIQITQILSMILQLLISLGCLNINALLFHLNVDWINLKSYSEGKEMYKGE